MRKELHIIGRELVCGREIQPNLTLRIGVQERFEGQGIGKILAHKNGFFFDHFHTVVFHLRSHRAHTHSSLDRTCTYIIEVPEGAVDAGVDSVVYGRKFFPLQQ